MQPQVLGFDEPSAQLDLRSRRRLIELLQSLPLTQLIATHDLDLALELCDFSNAHVLNWGLKPSYQLTQLRPLANAY